MKTMKISILLTLFLIVACTIPEEKSAKLEYKNALIQTAKRIFERKLTFGSGGDISVRIPGTDSLIIKATGNSLGDLDHNKLVVMNINGQKKEGSPAPSHEAFIHCQIYQLRKEIGAIMHMHSPYATAWATTGNMIPPVTQQSAKLLRNATIVPYYKVGSTELNEGVINAYKNPGTNVVYMENHGTFLVGTDLEDLFYKADVIENTAKIAFISNSIGQPILPEFQID
jgi:L-fuculose-phosphate aldolase